MFRRELYRCLCNAAVAAVLLCGCASVFAADPMSGKMDPNKPLLQQGGAGARQYLTNVVNLDVSRDPNFGQMQWYKQFATAILALHDQDRMNIEWIVPSLLQTRQQLFDLQWELAELGPLAPVVIDPPAAPPKIAEPIKTTVCTPSGCLVGVLVQSPVDPLCKRLMVNGKKTGVVKGVYFFPSLNDDDFGPGVLAKVTQTCDCATTGKCICDPALCACPGCTMHAKAASGCATGQCGVQGCGQQGGCASGSCGSGGSSSGGRHGFFGGIFHRRGSCGAGGCN